MTSTLETVKAIVVQQLGVEELKATEEASLIDELGADSLDVVEIVMALEDAFEIEISDDDARNIETVGDAARIVEELRRV